MNSEFLSRVAAYISAHHLLTPRTLVLVAVSGGADSMALLIALRRLGYNVCALHCNFHLRAAESDRDEQFVAQWCQRHDVPLLVHHFRTRAYARRTGKSIEMAARDLRYAWFRQQRLRLQAQTVAVAHHADDQAETLLLNLLRGTGLRGLAAMPPRRDHIIRPLLAITRKDILRFLDDEQETYVTDSTNLLRDARRNQLRLDVLPLLRTINPRANLTLALTAQRIQQTLVYYEKGVKAELRRLGATPTRLPSRDPILLHEWLTGRGFNAAQEADMITAQTGALFLSPTHRLLATRDAYVLEPRTPDRPVCLTLAIPGQTHDVEATVLPAMPSPDGAAYFDLDRLPLPLTLRTARPADRFRPFGLDGTRLLSDYLTDLHVDRLERQRQLVVADAEGRILWVVGRRAADHCRVTETTTRVLRLKLLHP